MESWLSPVFNRWREKGGEKRMRGGGPSSAQGNSELPKGEGFKSVLNPGKKSGEMGTKYNHYVWQF